MRVVWAWGGVVLLLAFYFGLVRYSSPRLSPAFDEPIHIRAGMTLLTRGAYVDTQKAWWTEVDPLTPPMDMFPALLARMNGQSPDYRNDFRTEFNHVLAARWASHVLGALALLVVFVWGMELWGAAGGLLSATCLAVHPLFIAHATIVSSDLSMMVGGLVASYAIWRIVVRGDDYGERFDRRFFARAVVLGLTVAFALVSKLSNVVFLGVLPAAVGWTVWTKWTLWTKSKRNGTEQNNSRRQSGLIWAALVAAGVPLIVALIGASIVYGSTGLNLPPLELGGVYFRLPFGHTFLRSLETAMTLKSARPPVFFFGGIEPASPRHYVAAYLIKTPMPLMLFHWLGVVAATNWLRNPANRRAPGYLLLLVLLLTIFFSTRGFYLGLRHWLLPLALLGVISGGAVTLPRRLSRTAARSGFAGVLLLVAAGVEEVVRTAPWHLSYFNPLSRGKLALVDSDGDWGEGLLALNEWQQSWSADEPIWLAYFGDNVPDDFGIMYRGLVAPYSFQSVDPQAESGTDPDAIDGYVAISKTQLAGTYMFTAKKPTDFYLKWRERKPDFVVGGSINIYDCRRNNTRIPQ